MNIEVGDHVKFEVRDEKTGESEWMWVRVSHNDEQARVVLGILDSRPALFAQQLQLGQEIAVSYDNIRAHHRQIDPW